MHAAKHLLNMHQNITIVMYRQTLFYRAAWEAAVLAKMAQFIGVTFVEVLEARFRFKS